MTYPPREISNFDNKNIHLSPKPPKDETSRKPQRHTRRKTPTPYSVNENYAIGGKYTKLTPLQSKEISKRDPKLTENTPLL